MRQLRHEGLARPQVPDAEIGLVTGLSMPDFGVLLGTMMERPMTDEQMPEFAPFWRNVAKRRLGFQV